MNFSAHIYSIIAVEAILSGLIVRLSEPGDIFRKYFSYCLYSIAVIIILEDITFLNTKIDPVLCLQWIIIILFLQLIIFNKYLYKTIKKPVNNFFYMITLGAVIDILTSFRISKIYPLLFLLSEISDLYTIFRYSLAKGKKIRKRISFISLYTILICLLSLLSYNLCFFFNRFVFYPGYIYLLLNILFIYYLFSKKGKFSFFFSYSMLDLLSEAIVVTDKENKIKYLNSSFLHFTGNLDKNNLFDRFFFDFILETEIPINERINYKAMLSAKKSYINLPCIFLSDNEKIYFPDFACVCVPCFLQ